MSLTRTMDPDSERAESARDALDRPLPSIARACEQVSYLEQLHECLGVLLQGNIRENPYFFAPAPHGPGQVTPGLAALRKKRVELHRCMLEHDNVVGSAEDATRVPGWNRLMLLWIVAGQVSICVSRLQARRDPSDPAVEECEWDLLCNELLTTPGGMEDVTRMSMTELRRAVDVFRDRLFMVQGKATSFAAYLSALELRAAEFACGVVGDPLDFDNPRMVDEQHPSKVSRSFIATAAWHFTWIRRHLLDARQTCSASFYQAPRGRGVLQCHADAVCAGDEGAGFHRLRASVVAFAVRCAGGLDTADHERTFSRHASKYNVSPGDMDAHSHVYGMGGAEQSTLEDVVAKRMTPKAATWAVREKWRRPMTSWVKGAVARGGKGTGGGAACEAAVEQQAVLYAINAMFMRKHKVKWLRWFVITHRGAGREFQTKVRQALRNKLPFLFQCLGRWACCVPKLPEPHEHEVVHVQNSLFCKGGEEEGENIAPSDCAVYLCDDAFGACALWALFLRESWGGGIAHSQKNVMPLLEDMLREEP